MSVRDILNKLAEKKALEGDQDFAFRLIEAADKGNKCDSCGKKGELMHRKGKEMCADCIKKDLDSVKMSAFESILAKYAGIEDLMKWREKNGKGKKKEDSKDKSDKDDKSNKDDKSFGKKEDKPKKDDKQKDFKEKFLKKKSQIEEEIIETPSEPVKVYFPNKSWVKKVALYPDKFEFSYGTKAGEKIQVHHFDPGMFDSILHKFDALEMQDQGLEEKTEGFGRTIKEMTKPVVESPAQIAEASFKQILSKYAQLEPEDMWVSTIKSLLNHKTSSNVLKPIIKKYAQDFDMGMADNDFPSHTDGTDEADYAGQGYDAGMKGDGQNPYDPASPEGMAWSSGYYTAMHQQKPDFPDAFEGY
jgi:hypothetical protein